jgi:predicted DsbA family dithiol-disulfide isomerase
MDVEDVPTQEEIRRLSREVADAAVEIESIDVLIDAAEGAQLDDLCERRALAERAFHAKLRRLQDARSRRIRAIGIAL